MKANKTLIACVSACALALGGCGSNPTKQEMGIVTGSVLGGVVGASLTGGSTWGTVTGAAAGGLIGNKVGKDLQSTSKR